MVPTTFKSKYKKILGSVNEESDKALKILLDFIDKDPEFKDKNHEMAYVITTVWHETWSPRISRRFVPCVELVPPGKNRFEYFEEKYGWKTKLGKELGNDQPGDGGTYYGRGYVMLTGKKNYARMSKKCGYGDLLITPDRQGFATAPEIAYNIMAVGMRDGDFTGKKLSDYYTKNGGYDFVGARAVVNGKDKARELADHAEVVYAILQGEENK